ncbi:MAG: hypothetical protein KDA45_00100 [Planctomycetales bacterium]|nr:hypothetical protein [Planctomycetales bacterium]
MTAGKMRTIVTAPGSLGDVNPLLAIARGLQAAGHDVLFLAAERYLPLARRGGLETRCLVSEEQFSRLAGNPQLWHPRHGARLIFHEAVEHFLADHYQWLEENCVPSQTLLVSHVLDFAGRVYRDVHQEVKLVSVLPAPAVLRSHRTPPRLSGFAWERWIPPGVHRGIYRAADLWLDRIGGAQINQMRAELGLPKVHRIFKSWWCSPDLVLCLFPEWFSIDVRDLPPTMKLVGFPLADSGDVVEPQVTAELGKLLDGLQQGTAGRERPWVFAPGTAHQHAAGFLRTAAAVCEQMRRPGVLLSTAASQLPSPLPPRVVAAGYLPFSQLLPHAAALVHHGGVGTTSQAFRAGVPQVVLPMAFDQFDNAERVAKLGCGSWFPMDKQSPGRLRRHLAALPRTAARVQDIAARVPSQGSVVGRAIDLIDSLVGR